MNFYEFVPQRWTPWLFSQVRHVPDSYLAGTFECDVPVGEVLREEGSQFVKCQFSEWSSHQQVIKVIKSIHLPETYFFSCV